MTKRCCQSPYLITHHHWCLKPKMEGKRAPCGSWGPQAGRGSRGGMYLPLLCLKLCCCLQVKRSSGLNNLQVTYFDEDNEEVRQRLRLSVFLGIDVFKCAHFCSL